MQYSFVMLPPASDRTRSLAAQIQAAVPQVKTIVCADRVQAREALEAGARAAYGTLDADLLRAAPELEWLACPAAGPSPSFYFPELVDSSVVVTNMRGIYSDHIGAHIIAFVLAFARSLHRLLPEQYRGRWARDNELRQPIHLPDATALIVGTGGIGSEAARHCKHFGMHVIGVDPRCPRAPEGVDELLRPDALDDHLGRADFVIVTVPQTPHTQGLFDGPRLALMKSSGVLINIGRGTTVKLRDLDQALRAGTIGGAALDVFEEEPLPADHPLWTAPNFLMTPHCAGMGPHLEERRVALLIENCRRFACGDELANIVDKANWF